MNDFIKQRFNRCIWAGKILREYRKKLIENREKNLKLLREIKSGYKDLRNS